MSLVVQIESLRTGSTAKGVIHVCDLDPAHSTLLAKWCCENDPELQDAILRLHDRMVIQVDLCKDSNEGNVYALILNADNAIEERFRVASFKYRVA